MLGFVFRYLGSVLGGEMLRCTPCTPQKTVHFHTKTHFMSSFSPQLPLDFVLPMSSNNREAHNRLFLRKVGRTRLARLEKARMAGRKAVHNDLPGFEARSREAMRAGNYFSVASTSVYHMAHG